LTLDIGISTVIVLQYLVVYFGYIFTAYKFYSQFHQFYNIVAQKVYIYPKEYKIPVEEELAEDTIHPIGFFRKEYQNANLILNFFKKYFVSHLSFARYTDEALVTYFAKNNTIDKNHLMRTIDQMLASLTLMEKQSVKYYIQVSQEQKDVVHEIIINRIIFIQLSLPSEKQTLATFNRIKNQWIGLVEHDLTSKFQFNVNRSNLESLLQDIGTPTDARTMSLDASLLNTSQYSKQFKNINLDLLELALKAHAFRSHHINDHKEKVLVVSKEKLMGYSFIYKMKALLGLHLHLLQFINKDEIGYGLKYAFEKNTLHFYGKPEASMEFETLVVQIMNKKGMILREIHIVGNENRNRKSFYTEQIQDQL